ncbi:MAG: hypothetical protein HQ483_09520 [Rhodospirillales bacterium]|nr:hypothetical protein [Rhodospirillales bacterium]
MSWGLWKTLLRPDHEEQKNPDRTEVTRAANYLQIGEFQLLQLAYHAWHGVDLSEKSFDKLFHQHMIDGVVPYWARHYARNINQLSEQGGIVDHDPAYHRYDHDYHTSVPNGVRKFLVACGCLIVFLGGGLILANTSIKKSATIFPPYFETEHLKSGNGVPETPDNGRPDSGGRTVDLPSGTRP